MNDRDVREAREFVEELRLRTTETVRIPSGAWKTVGTVQLRHDDGVDRYAYLHPNGEIFLRGGAGVWSLRVLS